MTPRIVHADAVVTGDREVVRDGAIVLDERCAILDVGAASEILPAHAGAPIERVRGAVFPGLVNAHTHLELSQLRGTVSGGAGFVPWVEKLVAIRAEARPEEDDAAIERAVSELDAFGTAAVGEVTNALAAVRALARHGIGGYVFHEVFGVKLEAARAKITALGKQIEDVVGAWPTADLVYAPAPHTLYTTHRLAVAELVQAARANGRRTSIHLAEHAAERRALEGGEGPIAIWYERHLGLPHDAVAWPRKSPVAFAEELGVLANDVLAVHLTDAKPEELERVASAGAPVVLCPRSNLHIETKLPPLLAMLAAGIEPALGTDSLASNASLDVLAEARALRDRFSSVPARDLVRMATWNGARALGRADLGRIVKGARPGLVAIDGEPGDDACAFVVASVRAPRRWIARRRETAT